MPTKYLMKDHVENNKKKTIQNKDIQYKSNMLF